MTIKAVLTRSFVALLLLSGRSYAQSVQPVIVEYKGVADGKFAVTNDSNAPMVVVLEPKSFSILQNGRGQYRPLDPDIHVDLSTMSMRLAPKQTSYVFYRASSAKLPAWFTVYAAFSPVKHSENGLDVRVMLPHTVYLYQKRPLVDEEVQITNASYSAKDKKLSFDIQNDGLGLGRVQEVNAGSHHDAETLGGFPLLPGCSRHLDVDWTGKDAPEEIAFRFEHFTVRKPVSQTTE